MGRKKSGSLYVFWHNHIVEVTTSGELCAVTKVRLAAGCPVTLSALKQNHGFPFVCIKYKVQREGVEGLQLFKCT